MLSRDSASFPDARMLFKKPSFYRYAAYHFPTVIISRMFELLLRIFFDNVGVPLSLADGSVLPPRCAICNNPVHTPARRVRIAASAVGAESARVTIYLHLCGWHARRRMLVGVVSATAALICGLLMMNARPEGKTMPTWSVIAFGGLIASSLVLIHSLVHDPYFRGLSIEQGRMEIKGFGRRFRESLRPEEIRADA